MSIVFQLEDATQERLYSRKDQCRALQTQRVLVPTLNEISSI